jgi:thiol-disulfide isomerase/thioredoxin
MRVLPAALYTGALLLSNAAGAQELAGDMRKLVVHEAPLDVPQTPFEGDGETTLGDLAGEIVVVNFWATWCAPCREEMPTLAALDAALGDEGRVVTIAVGRNDPAEMARFLQEVGADTLPLWQDAPQALARDMGVLGLPVTIILNPDGQEVARLTGDADWGTPEALAAVRAVAGQEG